MRNWVKILLIVLFLLVAREQYVRRLIDLQYSAALTAAYAGLFAALALSLFLTAFIRNDLLRWFFACLFTVAAVFCDSYNRIAGDYLSYSIFVSQIYSFAFVTEALQQYWHSVLWATASALLLLAGLGLRPAYPRAGDRAFSRWRLVSSWLVPAAPFLGIILLTTLLFMRGGTGAAGLPVMFPPLAYLNLLNYEALTETVGPREPVRLSRTGGPVRHDIVLIIDESVSANYLDINAPHGVRTPLGKPPAGVQAFNFGYAASIASCSGDVNVTLRFGGTREDYIRINATMPSIWQYAKAAGMSTVYVDAQRTGRRMQNMMTDRELDAIDEWIQFDDVPVRHRDMAVAETLAELINDSRPQLIVTNKMGAHFPVHDKFPDKFMQYSPSLPRGRHEDVGDTGLRLGFEGTAGDWLLYRNSYMNTLLWNVGEFFTRLFAKADLDNAVIIYTADHGQDLHERGNPGMNTHCGGSPVIEEGLVPLVVIQGEGLRTLDWESQLPRNRNRSSHYNIFPTLLQLMGFEAEGIRALYGNPLSVDTNDPFTFNTKFNGRMGMKPQWLFIDLDQIVTPPPPQ